MWNWMKKLLGESVDIPKKNLTPTPIYAEVGPKALDLILEFEGIDQPWKRPPIASGVSLGHGFDIGYSTHQEFKDAWERHFSPSDFQRLAAAVGKKGQQAQPYADGLRGVKTVTKEMAREVFDRCTLPKWRALAAKTFPGIHSFTPNQQGVLVSLIFNRGTQMEGSRRTEMKSIKAIISSNFSTQDKVSRIVNQILAMQRVWPSNDSSSGHPGIRRRRRAEAALFLEG